MDILFNIALSLTGLYASAISIGIAIAMNEGGVIEKIPKALIKAQRVLLVVTPPAWAVYFVFDFWR